MQVKNTTIQNRSKQERLNSSHTVPSHAIEAPDVTRFLHEIKSLDLSKTEILYSMGLELVSGNKNPQLKSFTRGCGIKRVKIPSVPKNQFDILGIAYQFLNTKMENLEKGSFYTNSVIADDFVSNLIFDQNQKILDPSCGSGAFLFRSQAGSNQIYGVDVDPIAVMIAKFNYFVKFPDGDSPHIFCSDFFTWFNDNKSLKFDYVIGNPPYGANIDIRNIGNSCVTSGESFSYFIDFGFRALSDTGTLRYLVPESLLNVKRHADIREFILTETNLIRVKRYSKKFTGVMSDVYQVELNKGDSKSFEFEDGFVEVIPKTTPLKLKNQIIVNLSKTDRDIIQKVEALEARNLSNSIFGLGVVTGDNKSKIFKQPAPKLEPIYTGKEVERYLLLEPKNYLLFDRDKLQQVAPDEIYRAHEKLVYKTISRRPKFAIDRTGALTSNSANILIPKIEGYTTELVMLFLNSDLYNFLHFKLFGGVNKIAKENLMALPFPDLAQHDKEVLKKLLLNIGSPEGEDEIQDYISMQIFQLTNFQVKYLRKTLMDLKLLS